MLSWNTVTRSNFPLYWSTTNLGNIEIYFSMIRSLASNAIALRENREKSGRQRFATRYAVLSHARRDDNAFCNVHTRTFCQLKRKICFCRERPEQSGHRDFSHYILGYEVWKSGRRNIRLKYFLPFAIRALLPLSPHKWFIKSISTIFPHARTRTFFSPRYHGRSIAP